MSSFFHFVMNFEKFSTEVSLHDFQDTLCMYFCHAIELVFISFAMQHTTS